MPGDKVILTVLLIATIYFVAPPGSAEEQCTSCHRVRHGLTGNYCDNCHYNTTLSNGRHIEKPFSPGFVHDSFDWEGDNANEKGLDRLNESCPACHAAMLEHTSQTLNVCEDCHVKGEMKKSKLIFVRTDIAEYTPLIYSHYNGSSIDVPGQSSLGGTKSSCFGYDIKTGEGTCHGVNFAKRSSAGGFYAFNADNFTGDVRSRGDPYHWNAPSDVLPDSKDCAFCHLQDDSGIRKAWGSPRPLPADSSHLNRKNKDCFGCHVDGEIRSFHGKEVVRVVKGLSPAGILLGSLFILAVFILVLAFHRRKNRSKQR